MANRVRENQLFKGKSWNGFTDKNHLIAAYDFNPVAINNRLEQVMDVNLGENFVSVIMKHGIHYIPKNKDIHEWYLENNLVENYRLLGAYEDSAMSRVLGTTPGFKAGANRSEFFLLFENKPFSATEIIVGMKPDLYRLWITDEPRNVGGDRWLYKIQLIASDPNSYIPNTELYEGSQWSSDGGLVPDQMSYTGQDISFKSHGKIQNRLSQFRMKHKIPGNMMDIEPMGFFVKGSNGKAKQLWISNVEYEYLKKAKWITASIVMNGHSNVWEDGSIGNIDKNGFSATTGAGFKEQWSTSNLHTWNSTPDLDFMTEIALDAVVGKIKMGDRKMVIKGGEHGLRALSSMVTDRFGASAFTAPWLNDGTGRAFSWTSNEVKVKTGQVMGIALINGIEFSFVLDPSKDDERRNKLYHPLGGLASSYEYEIMGFGSSDEKPNMQIVRRENETPIWGVEEGMRGFMPAGKSFNSPKFLSSAVDASTIHYFDPGVGAVVWNPTRVIRYYPEITRS
jgi:hypothetical protein